MSLILGIDPGVLGALALFDPGRQMVNPITGEQRMIDTKVVEIIDMPVFEVKQGKYNRKHIDEHGLANWLLPRRPRIAKAVIEEVTSQPTDSAASAFTFGTVYGALRGALAATMLPVEFVRPQQWKKLFGLTKDKDESRRAASRLFPEASAMWARKMDDGRAEALLIAVYGARVQMPVKA